MARQVGVQVDNDFSKGLITETSALSAQQGSCRETVNCIHKPVGNILRRKGFQLETNFSYKNIDRTDGATSSFLWKDVSGNGNISIFVLQVGSTLYFYNASTAEPISSQPFAGTIDLTDFSPGGAPSPSTQECQYAAGNGKLFICHPYTDSFYVVFNEDDSSFTTTQIDIMVRDFDGLDDSLAVDTRPTATFGSLSVAHHYNLLNQGWTNTNLTAWDTAQTTMPSNADIMWRFRNADGDMDFTTTTLTKTVLSNSPAPRGHYVLNVFNKDRATASGLAIDSQTTDFNRASVVAFFSGRVFYTGVAYPGFQSNIFFSQIIERDAQIGQCYQQNDPTDENLFDLLPSDGGVIVIQEAGTILKLVNVPGGLCVFASNGIWLITGSTGLGFTATDYVISKVSSYQTISHTSFIDIAGSPCWWNLEGIYKLDGSGQSFQVTSITEKSIKTFYNAIPPSEKRNARGYYNPVQGTAQWLFRNNVSASIRDFYEYDSILNLDTNTGAWYVWEIPSDHQMKVHSIVVLENRGGAATEEEVFDNSDANVTDNALENVTVFSIGFSIVIPNYKYVVSYLDDVDGDKFTFAEASSETYLDWQNASPSVDYTSEFVTGYKIAGDAIKDFQSNYVNFYSDNESKFSVQGVWDFSNTQSSTRWSIPQTVDHTNKPNYDFLMSRRKIRGRGKALQIRVTSSTGEPFNITGWSTFMSTNPTP